MARANTTEMRLRFTVGRLLATKKLLEYLRSTNNEQAIQEIESCFNGKLICNYKKLDGIIVRYIDEVFEQPAPRYVPGSDQFSNSVS